ncbi:hypothetical protein [Longimicrobium sp.]|uniref:hypothetical protein n=1 Tax=Longimicrobium sp. TaxID=2029185 RepID=UPI002E372410|nr:hypothetical protein [Longimicrobium sp.]HEX6036881.1 hypothetical protein [Longimicrobium sp.]
MTARGAATAIVMSTLLGAANVAAQDVDLAAARASLRAADAAHAAAVEARGIVDGLPAAFASDVYFLRDGADVLHGLEAVRADLAASPLAGARVSWATLRADVSADGTRGYTFGGGAYTAADGRQHFSRTLAFWRNEGGTWKVAAFLVNAAPDAPQAAPAGFFREEPVRGAAGVDEVMRADRDFAAQAGVSGVAGAFRDWMAPDGAMLSGPIYGPEALFAVMNGGRATLEWGPIAGDIAGSGDLGFTIGVATRTAETGARNYSKYLTIWRRQPGGAWRFVVDAGTVRPAPAA